MKKRRFVWAAGMFCFLFILTLFVLPSEAKSVTTITIGSKSFPVTYENNKTAKAFLKKCPVTFQMSELNGNEKYKYLDYELPSEEKEVKQITAGDIMLYGTDCIVIFYQSFTTSYSYTRIGRITDVSGLKSTVGQGSVKVCFSGQSVGIKFALNKKKLTLETGKTYTLKLNHAKAKKVKWTSSDKKIASVSGKGKIKAKKKGKVTITAKYKKKKYECRVTVKKSANVESNTLRDAETLAIMPEEAMISSGTETLNGTSDKVGQNDTIEIFTEKPKETE